MVAQHCSRTQCWLLGYTPLHTGTTLKQCSKYSQAVNEQAAGLKLPALLIQYEIIYQQPSSQAHRSSV